jgi:hypothetical protein
MPEAVQNMLILEYGTDESLQIIRERADELAAVLVEPVQSRDQNFNRLPFERTANAYEADILILTRGHIPHASEGHKLF